MLSVIELGMLALAACLVWWGATGLILSLVGLPERTYRWSMLCATLLAIGALGVVAATRSADSIEASVAAFAAALVVWGAIEMALLMGYVVGPRRTVCPREARGWIRFKLCWRALAHHELALAGALLLIAALTWGNTNKLAFYAFALLWIMRLSAKLNIFLGVSNAGQELLPARIAYLRTYFAHAPMNLLFPLSVTAGSALVAGLSAAALRTDVSPAEAAGSALLATFAALAVLEHWFLILPLPSTALWPWAVRAPTGAEAAPLAPAIGADG